MITSDFQIKRILANERYQTIIIFNLHYFNKDSKWSFDCAPYCQCMGSQVVEYLSLKKSILFPVHERV